VFPPVRSGALSVTPDLLFWILASTWRLMRRLAKTILRAMKYERIAPTLLYDRLRRTIPRFLASPTRDRGILAECRSDLVRRRDSATSPQQAENLTYEIRALEAFESSLNALEIGGLNFELAAAAAPLRLKVSRSAFNRRRISGLEDRAA